ncbi:hypothetical protein GYH30_022916 [Glycine max]|nr:hypothetical protein GYH30_022916 [Glycine max]
MRQDLRSHAFGDQHCELSHLDKVRRRADSVVVDFDKVVDLNQRHRLVHHRWRTKVNINRVSSTVGYVFGDEQFIVVWVSAEANEVDEAGTGDLGEDLDLVFSGTGAVAATGAFGGVVFKGASGDKFGCFDNDEELARVQGDSVDSVVVASTKEGVGGEAVGGGDDVENK